MFTSSYVHKSRGRERDIYLKTKVIGLKGTNFFVRRINYATEVFDENSFQKFVKILYPQVNRHLTWTFHQQCDRTSNRIKQECNRILSLGDLVIIALFQGEGQCLLEE